jgi:ribonuclease G
VSEPCAYCEGKGYHKSKTTLAFEIFRQIKREVATSEGKSVYLTVHPTIADLMYGEQQEDLEELEHTLDRRVIITPAEDVHLENYTVAVR